MRAVHADLVSGYVLAGGASRRMGLDKALLPLDGEPLAARLARVLREGGCAAVSLVGSQPELGGLGWPVVTDPLGDHHPLRGVVAALQQCRTPLALFTPCDLLALRAEDVAALLAQGGPCVAEAGGRRHHLLAVLPTTSLDRARALLASNGAARALTEALPAVHLPEQAVRNANTLGDLVGLGVRH